MLSTRECRCDNRFKVEMAFNNSCPRIFLFVPFLLVLYVTLICPVWQQFGEPHRECEAPSCPVLSFYRDCNQSSMQNWCILAKCDQCLDPNTLECVPRREYCADRYSYTNLSLFVMLPLIAYSCVVIGAGLYALDRFLDWLDPPMWNK